MTVETLSEMLFGVIIFIMFVMWLSDDWKE